MKKILILSGKGGTGKTTVASAFIELSKSTIFADCDVDAPNLDLIVNLNSKPKSTNFYGLPKAIIDPNKCIKCGKCKNLCKFNAIKENENGYFIINNYACESCGVCEFHCPVGAIKLVDNVSGELNLYNASMNFSTAKLKMGQGNSGKLVTAVKSQLEGFDNSEFSIIDGSPGIGCPVIASISGVDFVLIVTEPSISGLSDMKRIVKTVKNFNLPMAVCVNKYDINIDYTNQIENYCKTNNIDFVGKICYDSNVPKCINAGTNIINVDCQAKKDISTIYNNVINIIRN